MLACPASAVVVTSAGACGQAAAAVAGQVLGAHEDEHTLHSH